MGSRTYADMLAYWPTSTEPLAAPMNAIPKIVFSRSGDLEHDTTTALRNAIDAQQSARLPLRPPAGGWDDTRVLGADLAADIRALKAEPDKDLIAHGGASFARSLINLGCIDEYRLLIHPVVLGSGHALFKDATPFGLTLTEATSFASGIQGLVYRTE
jgi:dihydrofolate reductase